MRNSRRLVGGLILAIMMSAAVVSADSGGPGGPKRGTCGWLQGILYKVGNATNLQSVFERVFGDYDCIYDGQ